MGSSSSKNGLNSSTTAEQAYGNENLTNKVVLITGANTGIGKETARVFYKHNAHVVVACRDKERMENAIKDIKEQEKDSKGQIEGMILNLGDLDSVKQFAKEYEAKDMPIHILILNAGQMVPPYRKTPQGFESQMGINHFGHFALTNLLLPILKKTAESDSSLSPLRIVAVSSSAHRMGTINFDDLHWEKRGYSAWKAYGQSKLANILFISELSRKLQESGLGSRIHTYSLHPGVIATELGRESTMTKIFQTLGKPFFKSIPQGAATTVYCASNAFCKEESGLFYADCNVADPIPEAKNSQVASKLWTVSEELTGVSYPLTKSE